jgi:hypothetical protein
MPKLLITLMMIGVSSCSAMSTETNKKLFLQQVEQILEGVMDDKDRVSSGVSAHKCIIPLVLQYDYLSKITIEGVHPCTSLECCSVWHLDS